MNRRTYLRLGAGLTLSGLAGCLQNTRPEDSDGDGVPDPYDDAPYDPSIQRAVDRLREPENPIVYQREEEGPTTPDGQLNPDVRDNMVSVDTSVMPAQIPHFTAYGVEAVTLNLASLGQFVAKEAPGRFSGAVKALVVGVTYGEGEVRGHGESESFDLSNGQPSVEVEINWPSLPLDVGLMYFVSIIPAEQDVTTVTDSEGMFVHETDRFRVLNESGIERFPHPIHKPAVGTSTYERRSLEGMYELRFTGFTEEIPWEVVFYLYKSGYIDKVTTPRRTETLADRAKYVNDAKLSGMDESLGRVLYSKAQQLGFKRKSRQLSFLIDFVQSFPYVTDDVSRGFDDYSKYAQETIIDAKGDCEDTSILLAAIMQSSYFGLDTALLVPPGHMGVGIAGLDIQGTPFKFDGRQYFYIETTGKGWKAGQLPDIYANTDLTVIRV
jgi:hypothetical protein